MTQACPISGPAVFSAASMFAGDMFLPAALMISSFLRSTIVTKPSSSIAATSPVCSQPSRVERLGGLLRLVAVAAHHDPAAHEQLAVVGEPDLDARDRPADGAEPRDRPPGPSWHARQLAHPPHLLDDDPAAAKYSITSTGVGAAPMTKRSHCSRPSALLHRRPAARRRLEGGLRLLPDARHRAEDRRVHLAHDRHHLARVRAARHAWP